MAYLVEEYIGDTWIGISTRRTQNQAVKFAETLKGKSIVANQSCRIRIVKDGVIVDEMENQRIEEVIEDHG